MKRTFLVWVTAAMLVLAGSAAWAVPTINLCDLGEGDPGVTASGFSYPSLNPIILTVDEFASVTGSLFSNFFTVSGLSDSYGIKMLEPAWEGGGVSDFAILTVFSKVPFLGQVFELTFWSDGAFGFDAALAVFNLAFPTAPWIVENGTLQNLFNFGGLVVNAQSDVSPVPLPAALLLLGTGLVGLGAYAWKKH
jgi:hypothetical protein